MPDVTHDRRDVRRTHEVYEWVRETCLITRLRKIGVSGAGRKGGRGGGRTEERRNKLISVKWKTGTRITRYNGAR